MQMSAACHQKDLLLKYQHDNRLRCLNTNFSWSGGHGLPLFLLLTLCFGGKFSPLICASSGSGLGEAQESREDETMILFIFVRVTELGAGQHLKDHPGKWSKFPLLLQHSPRESTPPPAPPGRLPLWSQRWQVPVPWFSRLISWLLC